MANGKKGNTSGPKSMRPKGGKPPKKSGGYIDPVDVGISDEVPY